MLFESIPNLIIVDVTTVAASKLGRIVADITSKAPYFDTGTQWVPVNTGGTGGAAAGVIISDTAPASPGNGQLWWDSTQGNLKVFWTAANNWIDSFTGKVGPTGPQGIPGPTGATGIQGPQGLPGSGGGGFIVLPSSLIPTASQRWIPNAVTTANLGTLTLTANRGYFIPFIAGMNLSFTRMGFAVTTAAAGTAYCALYADNGTGAPGNLIVATAALSAGATGDVLGTVASTTLQNNTVYWLFLTVSSAPVVRACLISTMFNLLGNVAASASAYTYAYLTAAGAPAATAPTSGYTVAVGTTTPVIYLAP